MAERLKIVPVTVSAARKLVKQWHRHLEDLQGGLFAAGLEVNGQLCGVVVAGNPARLWQGTGRIVISRVAVLDTVNGCSKLYGAICRAAKALGYHEAWTYTLPEETGISVLASGFKDMGMTRGGEHDRPSRHRAKARRADKKRRWMRAL